VVATTRYRDVIENMPSNVDWETFKTSGARIVSGLFMPEVLSRTTNSYDIAGRVAETHDEVSNIVTRYVYDAQGRQTIVVEQDGQSTWASSIGYDEAGRQVWSRARSRIRSFEVDTNGAITSTTMTQLRDGQRYVAWNETSGPEYSEGEEYFVVENDAGVFYLSSTYPELTGLTPAATFDARLSRTTRTSYDTLGRVIKTTLPDGSVLRTVYDELGHRVNEISQHDPSEPGLDLAEHTTDYEYDESGQLVAVVLPPVEYPTLSTNSPHEGTLVRPRYEYEYDQYGNQTHIRDNVMQIGSGTDAQVFYNHDGAFGEDIRETRFEFDAHPRQSKRILPAGLTETTTYDANGRRDSHTDFEGVRRVWSYDSLGRIDKVEYFAPSAPSGPIVDTEEFQLDGFGRQLQVNQMGTTTRTVTNQYDDFG